MEVIRNFPDSELVANLQSGQRMEETIKAIHRSYFDSLCWYVMNNSGSRQDAEGLFQKVVMAFILIDGQHGYNDTVINNVIVRNREDSQLLTILLHY